jgi:hypothetical protein
MKTLEEEAENHANCYILRNKQIIAKYSFIEGANSNYVKAQIIQNQINVLKSVQGNSNEIIEFKINELDKELNNLFK